METFLIKHVFLALAAVALIPAAVVAGLRFRVLVQKLRQRRVWEAYRVKADPTDKKLLTQVGRWRLVEKLGVGAMATVYKGLPAAIPDETQAVAIKLLLADKERDAEQSERYQREVNAARILSHPVMVRLLDCGQQDGVRYMAMELVKGQSLRQLLKEKGRLRLEDVSRVLTPVMDGLHHAHQHGIVHRDIKPDNLLVGDEWEVKLLDFGLARLEDCEAVTQTGDFVGTPAYMAPEQVLAGGVDKPDPRSDQYSVGVMAYEMLAGRRPFEGEEQMSAMFSHFSKPALRLKNLRPDLPDKVDEVVMKMLQVVADARYPDMAAALLAWKKAVSK